MSVTPTPYGANAYVNGNPVNPSYFCLLSPPDTDTNVLNNILTGRHILRGSSYSTLTLPAGSWRSFPTGSVSLAQYLPAPSYESQGLFYCEASNNGLTRVPVTILLNSSKYVSVD